MQAEGEAEKEKPAADEETEKEKPAAGEGDTVEADEYLEWPWPSPEEEEEDAASPQKAGEVKEEAGEEGDTDYESHRRGEIALARL